MSCERLGFVRCIRAGDDSVDALCEPIRYPSERGLQFIVNLVVQNITSFRTNCSTNEVKRLPDLTPHKTNEEKL
nr:MAG TPA: hypothetical protein [Caudoviricetes sp.]